MVHGLHLYPQPDAPKFPYQPKQREPIQVNHKLEYKSTLNKVWHRFLYIDYPKVAILRGNFCQSSKRFRARTNGRQDAANCTVAVLFSKMFKMSDWNPNYVDKILLIGDDLLTMSISHKSNLRFEKAKPKDLFNNVYIDDIKITFTTDGDVVDGKVFHTMSPSDDVPTLDVALKEYFKDHDSVICSVQSIQVAFWKKESGYYYFDPHERDENGNAVYFENGKACVMRFVDLENLIEAFCANITDTKNVKFKLLPVNILRMSKVRVDPPTIPERVPLNKLDTKEEEEKEKEIEVRTKQPSPPPPKPPFSLEPPYSEYYEMNPQYLKKSSQIKIDENEKNLVIHMVTSKESIDNLPIELKPELVPSRTYFSDVNPNTGILRASTFKKPDLAPSISLYSLGMLRIYKSRVWTEDMVNKILHNGHKLYRHSFYRQGSGGDKLVALKDVVKDFEVMGTRFTARVDHTSVIGFMKSNTENIADLMMGLNDFFRMYDSGVIQGPINVAVWQEEDKYYMFDPCERDEKGIIPKIKNGAEDGSGKACVLWFKYLDDLYKVYWANLPPDKKTDPFFISNVVITDYVDVPLPWYMFVGLKPGKWILRGTFSQNNSRFSEENRNNQATAIAAIAIGFAELYNMEDWNQDIMDNVMLEGDEYYTASVTKLNEKNKFQSPQLMACELASTHTLSSISGRHSGKRMNVEIVECLVNGIITASDNDAPYNLKRGLKKFFEENLAGLISAGKITVSVWKIENVYFYFDSHTRDAKGVIHGIGTSCLLRIEQIDELAASIEANLEPIQDDAFNISACTVEVWETDESGVVKPPLHNYRRLTDMSAILYASLHEGKKTVFSDNANRQTLSNCLVANAMMKIIPSALWTTTVLDEILRLGNKLHEDAYLKVLKDDPFFEDELSIEQCVKEFRIGDYMVKIEVKPTKSNQYENARGTNLVLSTYTQYLEQQENPEEPDLHKCTIFTSQYATVATWCDAGVFYIFDPKERDPEGMNYERDLWSMRHPIEVFGEGEDAGIPPSVMDNKPEEEDLEPTFDQFEAFEDESEESFTPVIHVHPEGQAFCRWFATLAGFAQHLCDNAPPNQLSETQFTMYPLNITAKMVGNEPAVKDLVVEPQYVGPWHQFSEIEYGFWIVRATHCQTDLRYPDVNRGNQDAAMAFSFLLFQYNIEPKDWRTILVDAVLKYGDKLHTYCLQKHKKQITGGAGDSEEAQNMLRNTIFEPRDIFTELCLGEYTYKVNVDHRMIQGDLNASQKGGDSEAPAEGEGGGEEPVKDLAQAIQAVSGNNFIIHSKKQSFAVYKGEKMYYMFDPHCRGRNGLTTTAGVACILRIMSLDKLVETIRANLPVEGSNKFYIDGITIEKEAIQRDTIVGHVKLPEEPDSQTAFVKIIPGKFIIGGTISQEDPKFGRGPNIQSAACALVALAMSRIHRTDAWSKHIVDEVVSNGDRLYSLSADKLGFQFNCWEEAMTIKKCEKEFYIGVNQVICELIETCEQKGVLDTKIQEIMNLRRGVDRFFSNYDTHGVIQSPTLTVAIWKDDKFLYMFDPYPRNATGIAFPNGSACLMAFHSPQMLAEHCIANVLPENRCDEYLITPIEVRIVKSRITKLKDPCAETVFTYADQQRKLEEQQKRKKLEKKKSKRAKKVPKKWITLPDCEVSILFASFSKNSCSFSNFSRGRQDVAMAIIGVVMSTLSEPSCWTPDILDSILTSGDQLYKDSYLKYRPDDGIVQLNMILRKFFIDKYCVEIVIYKPSIRGPLEENNVCNGIYNFFLQERAGVFIALDSVRAIFQKGGLYYIFNPDDCDLEGNMTTPRDGRSVLLRYKDLNDIGLKLLKDLGPFDDTDPPKEYFLHAVQIKEIVLNE